MFRAFDVNKMNILCVYAQIWCPIVRRLVYKLKNEGQVQSLVAIFTSASGNSILRCLLYVHTHIPNGTETACFLMFYSRGHLGPSEVHKLRCHFAFFFQRGLCVCQHSISAFLNHIFKKVMRLKGCEKKVTHDSGWIATALCFKSIGTSCFHYLRVRWEEGTGGRRNE